MADYTIELGNQSKLPSQFMLFGATPELNKDPTISVYANVFMTTPNIHPPTGTYTFTILKEIYAICGTAPEPLADGVSVSSSFSEPVTLTTDGTPGSIIKLHAPPDSTPYLEVLQTSAIPASAGSFEFLTSDDITEMDPRNIFIGIGGKTADGEILPIATFQPTPQNTYQITPLITYYVATGSYTPGTIMNVTALGDPGTIDFTGQTSSNAIANYEDTGDWNISFGTSKK